METAPVVDEHPQSRRPAPIPVVLDGPGGQVEAAICPHRAPRRPGQAWSWRLVWRERGAQKQRALGRLMEPELVGAAQRRWREATGDPAAACTIRTPEGSARTRAVVPQAAPPATDREPRESSTSGDSREDGVTVPDLLGAFLAWHAGRPPRSRRKPKTLKEYRQRCGLLADGLGELPLAMLDDDVCEHLAERLFDPAFRAERQARLDAH